MTNIRRMLIIIFFVFVIFVFCACHTNTSNVINGKGKITFDGENIMGVQLNYGTTILCNSDKNGAFEFLAHSQSVKITPTLQGYFFVPSSITIVEDNYDLSFRAIKIQKLNGSLSLKSICIVPTSIASYGDNYTFVQNGKECIKLGELKLSYNQKIINVIDKTTYLYKNTKNYIDFCDDISFNCGDRVSIGFLPNVKFVSMSKEWQTTNSAFFYLNIMDHQTNADLSDNKITYNLYSINIGTISVTINISFIFEYYE